MKLTLKFVDRTKHRVWFQVLVGEKKSEISIFAGMLNMLIRDYILFERILVVADNLRGEDFSVKIDMPLFREEREKEL